MRVLGSSFRNAAYSSGFKVEGFGSKVWPGCLVCHIDLAEHSSLPIMSELVRSLAGAQWKVTVEEFEPSCPIMGRW